MLIALPPSEGKTTGGRGRELRLDRLSFPELPETRGRMIAALTELAAHPGRAASVLGLGPSQMGEVATNAALATAATVPADRLYTGVLYAALDLPGLEPMARRRAARSVLITSSVYGLLRPGDRVAPYRLAGGTALPGLGTPARVWRSVLEPMVADLVGGGLLVDLRSQTYTGFFRPTGPAAERTATVRVLLERDGRLGVVSHVNKATKGRLARSLLTAGVAVRRVGALRDALADLGWRVRLDGSRIDVIVDTV